MKKVILEIKITRGFTMSTVMDMDIAKIPGFKIDESYEPEPLTPTEEVAADMSTDEEIVLIRGEVEEDKEEELKKHPNVVNVWTDAEIQPFNDFPSLDEEETFDEDEGLIDEIGPFDLGSSSPCSPTDCKPKVPKGTIQDVAKYLRCDKIWSKGSKGQGVIIGICDTGVDKTKIPAFIGGWSSNPSYPPGTDPGGHGTMCATDAMGMSPDSKIYDIGVLKSLSPTVSGLLSDAIKAYNWALNQFNNGKGPHIISNSWGLYRKSQASDYAVNANHPFTRKVVELINKGIIITFAAGNCGSQCPSWKCGTDTGPGKSIWGANGHPKVITVGAANIKEEWIGYTSQGPAALDPKKPDFCAPSHFKGYTACDNGTSAANPVCAGVIALFKSKDMSLNQDKIKIALQKTAKNLCVSGWDQHSGYGMIQAEAAYKYLFPEVGPYKIAHAMWTHGNSIHVEYPDRIGIEHRAGFYTRFVGKPGTSNWFHYAIPTPVIVDNKRLKTESVMIQFRTSKDVWVTNVHVYDGVKKIASHDGLSLTGLHWFRRFDVKNLFVKFGVGISIGVKFGKANTKHIIDFSTAGADFIE
jgi:subtilisin family serine protease